MIKENIKNKRKELGLTQKELADALGLGKSGDRTIRRWENGESQPSQLEYRAIMNFANEVPFKNIPEEEAKFTFIDLFAGIGGIRLPFSECGGRCVFTSEWDKFAQKTYRINYGDEPKGDITKITNNEIPSFDILLAGFPCQPFSQAGKGLGFEDTRGTMFFEIERIIQAKRPKAVLLENVKRLKTHDSGRTINVIIKHLETLNYTVGMSVLRAADFGVPQNRERLFIVAYNNEYLKEGEEFEFDFPKPSGQKTNVGMILEEYVDDKYIISDKLYEGHLRRKEKHLINGNGFGFSLFNKESEYTNTISARYYKDGSEILIDRGEGKNPRKLTPRECARLQGFPEKFIIPVSDTQAYKQFGNSVSVPVVRVVAKMIISELEKKEIL